MKLTCLGFGPSASSESAGRQKGQRLRCNQFLNRFNHATSTFFNLFYLSNLISAQETCLWGRYHFSQKRLSNSPLVPHLWPPPLWTAILTSQMIAKINGYMLEALVVYWNGVQTSESNQPGFKVSALQHCWANCLISLNSSFLIVGDDNVNSILLSYYKD